MYKAGYDPQSFVAFFEKVEALEKKNLAHWPRHSKPTSDPDRIEKSPAGNCHDSSGAATVSGLDLGV